jgi:hypothetical protein
MGDGQDIDHRKAFEDMMPESCIMFDRTCPDRPFWLRLKVAGGIDVVELGDANGPARSLPAAVQACTRLGHHPTHSYEKGTLPYPIPASVVRSGPVEPTRLARAKREGDSA